MNPQEIIVKFLPGPSIEMDLVSESILIRKFRLSEMSELANAWGNYGAEAACYAMRDSKWLSKIEDESFVAIVDKGRELNAANLQTYSRWQQQTINVLQGGQVDMEKLVKDVALKSLEAQAKG